MHVVLVFIGGGLGSLARYGISLATGKFYAATFPLATFISNLLACLILGVTLYFFKDKIATQSWIAPLLVTGFCGGFSTFSTWSKETLDLFQQGNTAWAIANILISTAMGIGVLLWLKMTA